MLKPNWPSDITAETCSFGRAVFGDMAIFANIESCASGSGSVFWDTSDESRSFQLLLREGDLG